MSIGTEQVILCPECGSHKVIWKEDRILICRSCKKKFRQVTNLVVFHPETREKLGECKDYQGVRELYEKQGIATDNGWLIQHVTSREEVEEVNGDG